MSRRQKQKEQEEKGRSTADYYKLNTKAVEDLVGANKENSPEVSEEELRKYRSGSRFKMSESMKLLCIKFWFPAAVCYFFIWGLSTYLTNDLDMLFVTGIALGMVTEILTNNALRFFASVKGGNDRFMMFPQRSYFTFPLNILYAWLLLFLVYTLYNMINIIANGLMGTTDAVVLGVEPVLFGLFYLGADTLLIQAKHLCGRILADAKNKVKTSRG